jgi:hypothetical protein
MASVRGQSVYRITTSSMDFFIVLVVGKGQAAGALTFSSSYVLGVYI